MGASPPPERPARLSRRALLRGVAVGGAALVLGDGLGLEPRWLDVTRHDIAVPDLPASLAGFTIAHLSDVHIHGFGGLHEVIVRAVHQAQPQLVVLTGDIADGDAYLPHVERLCAELGARERPILATLGNWEHWGDLTLDALAVSYSRVGVRLLGNESLRLEPGICVVGVDDYCSRQADLGAALSAAPTGDLRLLLTHAPGLFDHAAGAPRFDLCLAGHTHGGQVTAFGKALVTPPGSGRFVAGAYDTPVGRAYVSRGIGTSDVPVRLACRPELPLLRLVQG